MNIADLLPYQLQIYKVAQGGRLKMDPAKGPIDTLSGAPIGSNRVQALVRSGFIDGAPFYLPTGQMPAAPAAGKSLDVSA